MRATESTACCRRPDSVAQTDAPRVLVLIGLLVVAGCDGEKREVRVHAERMVDAPIISAETHPEIGPNIQGPSLIRVPDWAPAPLGSYYLYFADHKGDYIRLAFADDLLGPWEVYGFGSLQLADSFFPTQPPEIPAGAREAIRQRYRDAGMDPDKLPHDPMVDMTTPHIASPDVRVDHANERIVMYYHGLESFGNQPSRVAISKDGIHFQALIPLLPRPYMRTFDHAGYTYALAMPGHFYRARDSLTEFEEGPVLFNKNMRHNAVLVRGDELFVFWTQVGDAPERILLSRIDLSKPWLEWTASDPVEVPNAWD